MFERVDRVALLKSFSFLNIGIEQDTYDLKMQQTETQTLNIMYEK